MPPHKKSKLGAGCYERGERGAWRDYLVVDAAGCTHSFPVAARYRLTRPLGRGAFGVVAEAAAAGGGGAVVAIKHVDLPPAERRRGSVRSTRREDEEPEALGPMSPYC